ncbi:unnamed protein product [Allacma fusca]|uniref:CID domain-containing protein n=1 Tax=Allacma fusca TaxID=39272 RepID=A0A8J2K6I9_9HEXA|nr:unnamed protein product [Allacma fusca]
MPSVEEIAIKYASQLTELRNNSKPLINSLTMMAEDHIRHAKMIVLTIENHLRKVDPEYKLPILYLIDSIVKNVKKDYVPLFSENITTTFTQAFSQVPEKIRTQLWKLRQTWNDVFPTKKLYSIDVRCHQVDPGWPITAAPPNSATIHVNPKFLQKALTIPGPTSSSPTFVTSSVSSPPISSLLTTGGLGDISLASFSTPFILDPPGDQTEAQMREQLLIKQKELLELQTKKLELELLHTKAQLEARTRKQVEMHQATKQQHGDADVKQQQLQIQAELAKHQTDLATSILSKTQTESPSTSPLLPTPPHAQKALTAEILQDPRKRRAPKETKEEKSKQYLLPPKSDAMSRNRLSPSHTVSSTILSHPTSPISILPPTPMSSSMMSDWKKSPNFEAKDLNHPVPAVSTKLEESPRDRSPAPSLQQPLQNHRDKDHQSQSPNMNLSPHRSSSSRVSPSHSPTKSSSGSSQKSLSPVKESGRTSLLDPRSNSGKRKRGNSKGGHDHDAKRDREKDTSAKDRSRSTSSSVPASIMPLLSTPEEPLVNNEVPSKRRKKSTEDTSRDAFKDTPRDKVSSKSSKDKSSRSSKTKNSRHHHRDSGGGSGSGGSGSKSSKESDRGSGNKDNYNARKSAVLQKRYRRTTEVSKMVDEEEELSKQGMMMPLNSRKDKENHHRGRKDLKEEMDELIEEEDEESKGIVPQINVGRLGGDVDLRLLMQGQDVDLRGDTSRSPSASDQMDSGSDHPPVKKSRNGNIIDDLFGREDVDLRQTASSSNWAQVKTRPSMSEADIIMGSPLPSQLHLAKEKLHSDQDIRDMLQSHPRPPLAISPANSVDSNRSTTCDPLGRPLLYNRLPDDPTERKRSLDSRTSSIDPVERFRIQYIEQPSMGTGHLKMDDLKKAVMHAQQQFQMGFFTQDQHEVVMRQLMKINEVNKIHDVQMQQGHGRTAPGPNPWTESESSDAWSQFSNQQRGGPTDFGSQFSGPNPWGSVSMPWGQPQQPSGPNPFEEAAAAAIPPALSENCLPPVNMMELEKVRKDTSKSIPIDKALRQVRFYGDTAVVLLGDEPREISFHKGVPKNVFIDQERDPVRCFIGKPVQIYLNRKKVNLKLGAPTRELYIDGDYYEALFGGPPVRVQIGRHFHMIKLEGPPPQVEMSKGARHDLLAGRVNLVIDGNITTVFLDNKPQLLDLCGFPVILCFINDFHQVLLNGKVFPANFGGAPMAVTVPSGRKHFLRLTSLTPVTMNNIMKFSRTKSRAGEIVPDGHMPMAELPFSGSFRGRGGTRGRGGPPLSGRGSHRQALFNMPTMQSLGSNQDMMPPQQLPFPDQFHPAVPSASPFVESNPLDVLANFMPTTTESAPGDDSKHSYVSAEGTEEKPEIQSESDASSSLNVQDLLSKLMMAGLLPAADASSTTNDTIDGKEIKTEGSPEPDSTSEEIVSSTNIKNEPKKLEPKEVEKVVPPLETVDVPLDKLKERREKLIAQICTGVQCGSCGLRFPPDQNVRYSQHLDWHFRQNRREKANARKALSRKWYYDLSDWIQFAEIEDLEERAQSLFETQEQEMESDVRSPGTVLNPDLYTVPSAGHDGAICPQCNEGFESFFDEDKEEWRLRDAHLAESEEPGIMKLYHPICHQDFVAALQGKSSLMDLKKQEEPSVSTPDDAKTPDGDNETEMKVEPEKDEPMPVDDDEVLILQEGKPEPVVMEIIEEEDDVVVPDNSQHEATTNNIDIAEAPDSVVDETFVVDDDSNSRKDSDNQNSMICIDDDDDDIDISDNDDNDEFNNKTDNEEFQSTHPPPRSCINHETDSIDNTNAISVSVLSSLVPSSTEGPSSPKPIALSEDEPPLFSLPGISSSEDMIFDILLGNSNSEGVSTDSPIAVAERPFKPIIYESMKFDVPTVKIKEEPVDPEELEESPGSLEEEIKANLPQDSKSTEEPESIDIDLTADDDTLDEPPNSASTAIDGNFLFSAQAPTAPMTMAPTSKIRIRITDAVLASESQSPKSTPPHQAEAPAPSPISVPEGASQDLVSDSSTSASVVTPVIDNVLINDEKLANSKPRLVGRKLVNYPPKVTGKEVSGLCTIC